MIVGSRESLEDLASSLRVGLSESEAIRPDGGDSWPKQVAVAEIQLGPYKDSQGWEISFHVEGGLPAEKVVPLHRSGPPFTFAIIILAFAVIGCISIVRWVANAF